MEITETYQHHFWQKRKQERYGIAATKLEINKHTYRAHCPLHFITFYRPRT